YHAALLTGDIGQSQEKALAARWPERLRADVVLMGHHGSRTSSHPLFVELSAASHAVAQVGHLSRYGHPHAAVVARWRKQGTQVHRSDTHGALVFASTGRGLGVQRLREHRRRYWHDFRDNG